MAPRVSRSSRRSGGRQGGPQQEGFKLFIGGIPWRWDDRDLSNYFSQFGNITFAKVILEKMGEKAGKSRGFGFIAFDRQDDAKRTIAQMNESEIEGRKVTVKDAVERDAQPRGGQRFDSGGRGGGGYGGGGGYQDRDRGGPPPRDDRRGYDSRAPPPAAYPDRGGDRYVDRGAPPPARDDRRGDRAPAPAGGYYDRGPSSYGGAGGADYGGGYDRYPADDRSRGGGGGYGGGGGSR